MKSFLVGFGAVLAVIIGLVAGFGIAGLIYWGIGSFVVWAFGINFVWTFWHGLAVAFLTVLFSPSINIKTKE